jgi:hypothetical protein
MLGSITPLGERSRGRRWGITVTWFFAGAVAAGGAVGAAMGLAGHVVLVNSVGIEWPARLAALAVAGAAALAFDTRVFPWELPGPRRQVNENWLYTYRGWLYGVAFGAQLGAGVSTFVTTAAVYVTLAGAFLVGDPMLGAGIGAVFGLVRALTLLPGGRVGSPRALAAQAARLESWESRSGVVTTVVEASVVVAAALLMFA